MGGQGQKERKREGEGGGGREGERRGRMIFPTLFMTSILGKAASYCMSHHSDNSSRDVDSCFIEYILYFFIDRYYNNEFRSLATPAAVSYRYIFIFRNIYI